MTGVLGKAVEDPVGAVVDLVMALEPAMSEVTLREVVAAVASGRAKQRRLAKALSGDAAVLRTGLSPAPAAIGELLLALRRAGAEVVAAPRCARCANPLLSLCLRGQDWYCGRNECGTVRHKCQSCGRTAQFLTNDGRRFCRDCTASPEESVAVLRKLVTAADPGLSSDVITAAICAAARGQGQLDRLANAINDRPELLTGAGAETTVLSVLRLIDHLCDAGATGIVRPACPRCHRMVRLYSQHGVRLCRNCVAKSRFEPCTRCGARREPATRDEHGQPVCSYCLANEPANQETCIRCGRRRQVAVRGADGPICPTCRPRTEGVCAICGRSAPCNISRATGEPWCMACHQQWDSCVGCGQVKPIRSGTRDQPLCATCTRSEPGFWRDCPTCGIGGQLSAGPCVRCVLDQRLHTVVGDTTGEVRPHLQVLYETLLSHDRPMSVLDWLNRAATADLLRRIVAGPDRPTHESLDELPDNPTLRHLRRILVATNVLPPRDERLTITERWVRSAIAGRTDPQQRELLHRYVVWHLLRRLRRRTAATETTSGQATSIRTRLRAAIVVLDWLTTNGHTLKTCRQADLDTWLASDTVAHRYEVAIFIRWATSHQLSTLELPNSTRQKTGIFDTERRWEQARRLLHDDTLTPHDRLAGLLVLLYAQSAFAISRLRTDHLDTTGDHVLLQLGREPVVLPEPLGSLARQVLATRRTGRSVIGAPKVSPWLLPGGRAGQPVTAANLAQRLQAIGIHPKLDRETAFFHLTTELPAAVLSRLLGVHIGVATAWQRASAGDWLRYAAEVGQRPVRHPAAVTDEHEATVMSSQLTATSHRDPGGTPSSTTTSITDRLTTQPQPPTRRPRSRDGR